MDRNRALNLLSLAIGKEGQNARLAARLTGCKIDIKPQSMEDQLEPIVAPAEQEEPAAAEEEAPEASEETVTAEQEPAADAAEEETAEEQA